MDLENLIRTNNVDTMKVIAINKNTARYYFTNYQIPQDVFIIIMSHAALFDSDTLFRLLDNRFLNTNYYRIVLQEIFKRINVTLSMNMSTDDILMFMLSLQLEQHQYITILSTLMRLNGTLILKHILLTMLNISDDIINLIYCIIGPDSIIPLTKGILVSDTIRLDVIEKLYRLGYINDALIKSMIDAYLDVGQYEHTFKFISRLPITIALPWLMYARASSDLMSSYLDTHNITQ
jgi:hypothetical protein